MSKNCVICPTNSLRVITFTSGLSFRRASISFFAVLTLAPDRTLTNAWVAAADRNPLAASAHDTTSAPPLTASLCRYVPTSLNCLASPCCSWTVTQSPYP